MTACVHSGSLRLASQRTVPAQPCRATSCRAAVGRGLRSRQRVALPARLRGGAPAAAEGGEGPKPVEGAAPSPGAPAEAEDTTPGLKEGQLTAIITGALSLVLGIGYLALVQAMGDRELLPPPPEALGL